MQKILYVEDDLSLIDGLQYTLEASGYMVDNAKTVKEALALFRKNTYDLLLLDVTLPDGTGFDVCKAVRNSSKMLWNTHNRAVTFRCNGHNHPC